MPAHDAAFGAEHVHAMLTAFDDACAKLHLRKGGASIIAQRDRLARNVRFVSVKAMR
jgi:hypothetical protein